MFIKALRTSANLISVFDVYNVRSARVYLREAGLWEIIVNGVIYLTKVSL